RPPLGTATFSTFLLHSAADHRDLHSFPTRRSSDLGNQCKAYGAPGIMRVPGRLQITWQDDNTLKIETDSGRQTRLLHFGASSTGDRKSTRLNSSHVAISYAVFCLKKKKKK